MTPKQSENQWTWQDSLYDHYKDSFQQIRNREARRDSELLIVIGLLLALAIAVTYTAALTRAIGGATIGGLKLDLSLVPAPAILSTLWVVTLAIVVRYCQDCINVERQYGYLHTLEDKLGDLAGDRSIFSREGRSYLNNYPHFSKWAWVAYVYVFPTLAILAALVLIAYEWVNIDSSIFFKLADTTLAFGVCVSFFLYRLFDPIRKFFLKKKQKAN